jgi:hypothetical protein
LPSSKKLDMSSQSEWSFRMTLCAESGFKTSVI